MQTRHLRCHLQKNRPGFMLLVLVIAMGIMVLIVALYSGSMDPFAAFYGSEADRYSDPNAYPWEEGHLFIDHMLDGYDMGGRRPPFRAQPKLEDKLDYRAEVYDYDSGEPRGEILLIILADGDAKSMWTGQFEIEGERYEAVIDQESYDSVKANILAGNTAPLKIYEDEDGRDRSKLYVITSGPFELKSQKEDEGLIGGVYITAWIDKDYNAEGLLSIPSFIDGETAIFYWGPVEPFVPELSEESEL